MNRMLMSFWLAIIDSFRPRVVALSLLPLGVVALAAMVLGYFYWAKALAAVVQWMNDSTVWNLVGSAFINIGITDPTAIFAPIFVVLLATPILILLSLLLVTMFMTPVLAGDVAKRRFPELAAQPGSNFWRSFGWAFVSTLGAAVALVVTLPLWLIPPLAFLLPPLIWGWLTYRILSFDVLTQHATAAERQLILEQHRWPLLMIGVVCGFLGAAPSLVWASGVIFTVAFAVLIPLAVWLYTWVFALSSLWYAHYCLGVLQQVRGAVPQRERDVVEPAPPTPASAAVPDAAAAPGPTPVVTPVIGSAVFSSDDSAAVAEESKQTSSDVVQAADIEVLPPVVGPNDDSQKKT